SAGTFKLHLVPSGILNPECVSVVGPGVVVDPPSLVRELVALQARGITIDQLLISERAHVVMPYHPVLDALEETHRESGEIGTTRRGNGPAYSDKVARRGVRIADLRKPDRLDKIVREAVAEHNELLTRFYGAQPLDPDQVVSDLELAAQFLRPFIGDAEARVQEMLIAGKRALIECAQGPMLDVDFGTYPYVTSSSSSAAGACQGAGIAPVHVDRVIGVYKAYSTRVGAGPMPTELHDETGELIRQRGREYGTSTGRPRRTGWFDGVAARHVARWNGVTEVAVTLTDVLDVFEEIQVARAYRLDGEETTAVPSLVDDYFRVEPVYETVPGWQQDVTGARTRSDLPENALGYLRTLETFLGAPVTMAGVGPGREQLVPLTADAAILGGSIAR
ncbi:MAG: adenylosuccinate synthase, partial [Thermomicrobiales bacterium]|nr:adenylosuccinate synthase [Thermomicrobiales bacterium]